MRFGLEGYLGDSSVWVGWLFESDSTVQYEGPWVDDILIRKYVAGEVTVQGSFSYADRNNNPVPARFTKVYLYDQDLGGSDDLLDTTVTDANGLFQFRRAPIGMKMIPIRIPTTVAWTCMWYGKPMSTTAPRPDGG